MCGGRGTRLETDREKPLFRVGGRPMVDRVRDALAASRVDAVHAVGSQAAPRTLEHLADSPDVTTVEAPGEGYVPDLQHALERVDPPVLTATADLPLLSGDVVDDVLAAHAGGSLTVCVPAALKRQLGVSVETTIDQADCAWTASLRERELAPTGLNVVGASDDDAAHVSHDARLAVNVNRLDDAAVAEALLPGERDAEQGTGCDVGDGTGGER
jgi:adenosylcobinamide-phosphate guanylyltransferase